MRKIIALLLMTLLLPTVAAQGPLPTRMIKTLIVLGKGIAISSEDPIDFEIVKVGIGKVIVIVAGEEVELSVGVLWFGDQRYKIKDIVTTNETVEGNVYLNDTLVGNIALTLYMKQKEEIWAGSLTINEKAYNVYILEGPRKIKPLQLGVQVADYCKSHPDKCTELARGIGRRFCEKIDSPSCREKIINFCKEHPQDRRCKALFISHCALHPFNKECREELRKHCLTNPEKSVCKSFCEKHPLACGIKAKIPKAKQAMRQRMMRIMERRKIGPRFPPATTTTEMVSGEMTTMPATISEENVSQGNETQGGMP
jgi:hypothetical protein